MAAAKVAETAREVFDAAARAPLVVAAGLTVAGGVFYLLTRKGHRVCTVSVPATTANLSCGFDAFGAGLELRMSITAELAPDQRETMFTYEGEGAGEVPLNETNLIWKCALVCQKKYAPDKKMPKLKIHVKNPVPFGRGLGSSATAIVGGCVLASEFLDLKLTRNQILDAALIVENHPDNLSAAIWGKGTVSGVSEDGKSMVRTFQFSGALQAVVVVPDFQLSTEKARGVLPRDYSREDCVFNLQRCGLLPLCLSEDPPDFATIRECMKDRVHQNQRKHLVPGLAECLALPHGDDRPKCLVSTALSGAGPTILALCCGSQGCWGEPEKIGKRMQDILKSKNIQSKVHVLPFCREGIIISWS